MDAWAVIVALLADPGATRAIIEQLAALPAVVRRHVSWAE